MRSSASARHISATPSWLERSYSRISPCTSPVAGRSRKVLDQPSRQRPRLLDDRRRQLGGGDQRRHDFGLGSAIERVDRGAPAVVADELGGEGGKRPYAAAIFLYAGGQWTSARLRQKR